MIAPDTLPPATLRPATTPGARVPDAVDVLRRHGDNPSAFLALNRDTRHFRVPGRDGLIAYRPAGRRWLVQLGGVFAGPDDQSPLLDAFLAAAAAQRRRVVAVQLLAADAARYARQGFRVNQLGSSYSLDLDTYTLAGKRFMRLRNKISRARREGVEVREVGADPSVTAGLARELDEIDREWLDAKGRGTRELDFMVGERGGDADAHRRLLVAEQDGRVVAYLSCSPVHGTHPGWLYDLSRRRADVPPGVAELLTATAAERFHSEGARWLHFGLTPFTGIDGEHELDGSASPAVGWTVRQLAGRGERLYPARDQAAYKLKWGPQLVRPEYIAFQGRPRPGGVWQILRLTRAV